MPDKRPTDDWVTWPLDQWGRGDLIAEVKRLREAISWYVDERERYLRREPTAGLDEAWEALRRVAR